MVKEVMMKKTMQAMPSLISSSHSYWTHMKLKTKQYGSVSVNLSTNF